MAMISAATNQAPAFICPLRDFISALSTALVYWKYGFEGGFGELGGC